MYYYEVVKNSDCTLNVYGCFGEEAYLLYRIDDMFLKEESFKFYLKDKMIYAFNDEGLTIQQLTIAQDVLASCVNNEGCYVVSSYNGQYALSKDSFILSTLSTDNFDNKSLGFKFSLEGESRIKIIGNESKDAMLIAKRLLENI